MNVAKARVILLEYLTQPDFDRVGFLKQKQKESERTPTIFIRYILEAFKHYFDLLGNMVNEARAAGNDVKDYAIPLYQLVPKIYPAGTGHLYFSQMPEYLEGIKQFMAEINEPENKGNQERGKTKHKPSEREREALYLYYTQGKVKRSHELYQLVNWWNKDDNRQQSNHHLKTYNTTKGHMEAVKMRVLSEKSNGWEKTEKEIQSDIENLTINFNKKVPG
jgi:hypothetical protein